METRQELHYVGNMSIQRVAQLAGVPYSTTWRVINRIPGVSPEASDAVKKAVAEIGYVRSVRRPLRGPAGIRRRSRGVALLYLRESTPLSVSTVRAVQRILIEQQLNLIFGHVTGSEDLPPAVAAGEVDGILGYGQFPAAAVTSRLMEIPAVWMMSRTDNEADPWGDRVMPDHRAIGRMAAKYLLDKGHRHLAFYNLAPKHRFLSERGEAFAAAAEGLAESVKMLVVNPELPSDSEAAIAQAVEMWEAAKPRPTGLFVPRDMAAVAMVRHLVRHGIHPGRDVEVISCDNQPDYLRLLEHPPVSIDLGLETIAHLAVERLLWRMRQGTSSPPVVVLATPVLSEKKAQLAQN